MATKRKTGLIFIGVLLLGHLLMAFAIFMLFRNNPTPPAPSEEERLIRQIQATETIDDQLPLLTSLYDYGSCSDEALVFVRKTLREAARQQHLQAQLALADTYVAEDPSETLFWWQLAANNTFSSEAQFALGCARLHGYGGTFDETRGRQLLELAKSQGHAPAYLTHLERVTQKPLPKNPPPTTAENHFLLGLYAAAGYECDIDPVLAETHWKTALQQGHLPAALFLGAAALRQNNLEVAIDYLSQASQADDPAIDTLLAHVYLSRVATPDAISRGGELLQRAAAKKFPPALYFLGHYTLNGLLPSEIEPYRYFRMAIDIQPFPLAVYAYGDCLFYGKGGVEASPKQAFPWIQIAAKHAILPAQWLLAKMYREGIGCSADPALASQWEATAKRADSRSHEEK